MTGHGVPIASAERSDARANRERILEAAASVFGERGIGAEVKEIADRAGVGVGTIYRNFATKDDLVLAIVGGIVERFEGVVERVLEIDDPVEAVQAFLGGVLAVVEVRGDVCRAILAGNLPAGAGARFASFIADRRLEAVFQRGIDRGLFRADLDPLTARALVYACCDPLVYFIPRAQRSAAEVVEGFTSLVLRSLCAVP